MGKRKLQKGVRSRELAILFFSAIGIMLLLYFAHIRKAGDVEGYPKDIDFETIGELSKGDKVYSRGLEIGYVSMIQVSPEDPEKIRVTVSLDDIYMFREDYSIELRTFGSISGATIHIHLGNPTKKVVNPKLLVAEKSRNLEEIAIKIQENLVSISDNFSDFSENLDDKNNSLNKLSHKEGGFLQEAEKNMKEFENSKEELGNILSEYKEMKEKAEESFKSIGNLEEEFEATETSIKSTRDNLKALFNEFDQGEGDLAKFYSDDKLTDLIKEVGDNFDIFSSSYKRKDSSLYLLFNDEEMTNNFDQGGVYHDEMTIHFEKISHAFDNAEGSLGLWAKDGVFYEDMQRAFDNIDDTINDAQQQLPTRILGSYIFNSLQGD
jgi:hypothetical protein